MQNTKKSEPTKKVKSEKWFKVSSLSGFDGEFLCSQMDGRWNLRWNLEFVYSFWCSFWISTNHLPSWLLWSGVKWPFCSTVAECVMLLNLCDKNFTSKWTFTNSFPLKTPGKIRQLLGLKLVNDKGSKAWLFLMD